jgi:hypothetical protein
MNQWVGVAVDQPPAVPVPAEDPRDPQRQVLLRIPTDPAAPPLVEVTDQLFVLPGDLAFGLAIPTIFLCSTSWPSATRWPRRRLCQVGLES